MDAFQLSRRWLLRLIPAAAIALPSIGLAQQAVVPLPGKDARTNYRVMLTSLIPHAPKNKKGVFLDMKAGERVSVRQYLDLPLVLEIDPFQGGARFALNGAPKEIREFYTVRLLDEQGKEIKQVNIGEATTVPFVDQRLLVFLSEAT